MFKSKFQKLSNFFLEVRPYNTFYLLKKDFFSINYHKIFFKELISVLTSDNDNYKSLPLTVAILIVFLTTSLFIGVFKVFIGELLCYAFVYYVFCLLLFRLNLKFLKKVRGED